MSELGHVAVPIDFVAHGQKTVGSREVRTRDLWVRNSLTILERLTRGDDDNRVISPRAYLDEHVKRHLRQTLVTPLPTAFGD